MAGWAGDEGGRYSSAGPTRQAGLSVTVRRDAGTQAGPAARDRFLALIPNQTFCEDDHLARVGFMHPQDVEGFVHRLETLGLTFLSSMSLAEAYAALLESFSDYHSPIAWQRQLLDRIVEEARREGREGTPAAAAQAESSPTTAVRSPGLEAIGVDGCKAGWLAAIRTGDQVRLELFPTFRDLLTRTPVPGIIAVDIPIGLAERGSRSPDLAARKMLSPLRASSVFPAPLRPVAYASSYEEACRIGREIEGKALSRQTWAITPKIREVDQAIRTLPTPQALVREVHPEVCFSVWNGGTPMHARKSSAEGQEERRRLVESVFGPVGKYLSQYPRSVAQPDDVLDAFAALWTAQRILEGTAVTMPPDPTPDGTGLVMEIVA